MILQDVLRRFRVISDKFIKVLTDVFLQEKESEGSKCDSDEDCYRTLSCSCDSTCCFASEQGSSDEGLSTWIVVLIVILVLCLIILVSVVLGYYKMISRKKERLARNVDQSQKVISVRSNQVAQVPPPPYSQHQRSFYRSNTGLAVSLHFLTPINALLLAIFLASNFRLLSFPRYFHTVHVFC